MRIILLCLTLTLSWLAHATPIQEYVLANGLKIIVKEDHRAPVVTIQLWYKVGASYEHEGITGISHVLEHMMSKGTLRYPKGTFSKLIAANGGLKNATTAADFTFYYTEITPDKLPLIFELEADRMHHLTFAPEVLTRELRVVMEERRMRTDDNPFGTLRERLRAAAFLASPYHHPVVGWPTDIKHLTVTDLQHWYQQWYAPNNATLVVVGDIQPQQVFAAAKQYFGVVPARSTPPLKPQTDMKPMGEQRITVHFPVKNTALSAGYRVPSINTATQAWEPYALMLLAAILNNHQGSLHEYLIHKHPVASHLEIEYIPYSRLDNLFVITATVAPGKDLPLLEQHLTAAINRLQTHVVTAKVLQRAKKQLITHRIYLQDHLAQQARELGRLEAIGVTWHVLNDFEKNIQAISAQQLQDIAQRYLIQQNLTLAILKPLPKAK